MLKTTLKQCGIKLHYDEIYSTLWIQFNISLMKSAKIINLHKVYSFNYSGTKSDQKICKFMLFELRNKY